MIIVTNESKTLAKHITCKFKCKFDGRKCNSNVGASVNIRKIFVLAKRIIFGILLHVVVKIGKI